MPNVSIFPSVALCNHVFHDSFTTSRGRHTTPIHVHFLPTSFNGVGIESGNHDDTRSLVKQIYNTIPLFHPFSIILLHMADIAPASHYICGRTLHLWARCNLCSLMKQCHDMVQYSSHSSVNFPDSAVPWVVALSRLVGVDTSVIGVKRTIDRRDQYELGGEEKRQVLPALRQEQSIFLSFNGYFWEMGQLASSAA